jgi:membrane fusion protein, multidrug efflux system
VRVSQTPSAPINGVVPMVAALPSTLGISYGAVGTITYRLTIGSGPQIPMTALQSQAGTNYVYTVVSNKAVPSSVTIIAEAGNTAVVQGVNAGDTVIINPPPGLLPGATVQVVAAASAGSTAQTATGQRVGGQGQRQQTIGSGQDAGQTTGQRTGGRAGPGTGAGSGARTGTGGSAAQPTAGGPSS